MGEYFLGELRMFSFNWAPQGWALCNGALMQNQQNVALSSLLGTTFGGVPSTSFNLPDLQGRTPLGSTTNPAKPPPGVFTNYSNGTKGGAETVTLTAAQTPAHTHAFNASTNPASSSALKQSIFADVVGSNPTYFTGSGGAFTPLDPSGITSAGAGGAHANMQPFLVMNYCIAVTGLYPPRN